MYLLIFTIGLNYNDFSNYYFNNENVLDNQDCLQSETIITNCTKYQNSFSLINCIFNSFKCSSQGGAMYLNLASNTNTSIIQCCKFRQCSSTNGGAIYSTSSNKIYLYFDQCVFENNIASSFGGAIYSMNSNSNFSNCNFLNNTVESISSPHGGALYFTKSSTYFTFCIINNNTVKSNKSGTAFGGAIYYSGSTLEFNHTIFINNSVISNGNCEGGAIRLDSSTGNFSNCCFKNNTSYGNGISSNMFASAVDSPSNNLNFFYCTFIKNMATNNQESISSINGGVLYLTSCQIMLNCTFENNCVCFYGNSKIYNGLIHLESMCNFSSCDFSNNVFECEKPSSFLNIFFILTTNSELDNCYIFNNTAISPSNSSIFTTGFFQVTSSCQIKNTIFINNTGLSYSLSSSISILYISSSLINVKNCSFIDNNFNIGSDIYCIFKNTNLTRFSIDKCLFERKKHSVSNPQPFIYIQATKNNAYPYTFTNNKVLILNTNTFYIFDGNIDKSVKMHWTMKNNCLFTYNSNFYKKPSISFYDETGDNLIFTEAFHEECDFPTLLFSPSQQFTESYHFSNSNKFSKTFDFSQSIEFTQTDDFTKTREFSHTIDFSKSFIFSQTIAFSKSHEFNQTIEFSKSSKFSQTVGFSKSNIFSKTSMFSKSIEFSKTPEFSKSNIFIHASDFFSQSVEFSMLTKFSTISGIFNSETNSEFNHKSEVFDSIEFNRSFLYSKTYEISKTNATTLFNSNHQEYSEDNLIITYSSNVNIINSENNQIDYSQALINPNEFPRKQISPGAIAGIAVAIILTLLICTLIILFVLKRRKEKTRELSINESNEDISIKAIQPSSTNLKSFNEDEIDLNFWL